jgi:PAS domain S-box-containing protein
LLSDEFARERATLAVDVEAESGERTWEVHVALRDSRSDRFEGTVGVIHDATERIEGKQELRKATARYQHLVETSPAPIVIYDSTGTLVFANDAAAALVGAADPDDLVGTPAAEFIHPDQREAARGLIDRVLSERVSASGIERTVVGFDGTEREVLLGTSPTTYEDEPAGQVVLVDVTDLGRA